MRPIADILADLPPRLSQLVRQWERRSPQAPAMIQGETRWSYAQLGKAMDEAGALLKGLEVRPGDRLMLVGENCLLLVAMILAAGELDAWAAIINARLSEREIDTIRDHCGARRVIYTTEVSAEATVHARRHGAQLRATPLLGSFAVGPLNHDCGSEEVEPGNGQVAALIYTSGTTGTPKGVMLTHRNIMFIGAVSGGLRDMGPGDVAYGVLPMSHVFGLASVLVGTLYGGACLHVAPRFAPAQVLADLKAGLTMWNGVPAMFAKFLEHIRLTGAKVEAPALRFLSAGGSPLDPAIKAETEAVFGQVLNNGYGLTESAPTICQTRLDAPRTDCSVGHALPGVEVRIVGEGGKDVPKGEVGELWSRGPGTMKGYYRAPAMTAEVINSDGWLNTGDFARQDADGALFIVGRAKELIIRSGFNVYPAEVEAVFNAHPLVTHSAVVGRPAADGNEEVVAFVQVAPGTDLAAQTLLDWAAQRLAPYKRPGEVVVVDHLPAGATGKILKNRLAEAARNHSYDTL
ncbi:Long-chain-fatty-acid--CoA ligase [Paramagnetospirillum magnetotacticum MS-1]|uniref:Long-chain-fatty-acid--CoA ligase n=1 Tax=Paramagnetospirillum magnetotacticum MS-1 TaxID=272627 RepID=A0A0C2UC10_PARME|nr:AMP-binding protein [Paramagnetospirillum magnetotacticum]KIL99037.1 Long-chain-fatty-acid--CoA ligase [Paramagnetospirillum magnetotacticum MS-1]